MLSCRVETNGTRTGKPLRRPKLPGESNASPQSMLINRRCLSSSFVKQFKNLNYCNDPKNWDRYAVANIADPDQTAHE